MSKYYFEFKKKVVLAYLNGEGGYRYLSKTYGVPAQRNIEQWAVSYTHLVTTTINPINNTVTIPQSIILSI